MTKVFFNNVYGVTNLALTAQKYVTYKCEERTEARWMSDLQVCRAH